MKSREFINNILRDDSLRYFNVAEWIIIIFTILFVLIAIPFVRFYAWSNIYNWYFLYFVLPKATKEQTEQLKDNINKGIFRFKGLFGQLIKKKLFKQLEYGE